MKKTIIITLCALLAGAATVSHARLSGTMGLASDRIALIYGVAVTGGDVEAFHAPAGMFCGVSRFTSALDLEWTGFAPAGGLVWHTLPGDTAVWLWSCINPSGPKEVILYSQPSAPILLLPRKNSSSVESDEYVLELLDAVEAHHE